MRDHTPPLRGLTALIFSFGAFACSGSAAVTEDAGGGDKAALEAAAALVKQPVALITAYQPYLAENDGKDVYAPKRRSDLTKAAIFAAGEIRFAANGARQKFTLSSPATKDLEAALGGISTACTDAADTSAFQKCDASVKALDGALEKAGAAAAAAGAAAKFPRVAADSITEEANKALAPFLKALKPGPAEQAYFAKRSDAKATYADVSAACQSAADEMAKVMAIYEKSEEPIRLVAVTHKLSIDSQCKSLDATDGLKRDLDGCKKKAKSIECKTACAKVRTRIEDGIPAAAFATLEADANAICEK